MHLSLLTKVQVREVETAQLPERPVLRIDSDARVGVEKSRNLMTVRLASTIGMEKIADLAERFGIFEDLPPFLSFALGAGEVTLLDLTVAYGSLVNGGREITPTLIEKIQDRHGTTLYRADPRSCENCVSDTDGANTPNDSGNSGNSEAEAFATLKRVRSGAPPPILAGNAQAPY